MKREVVLFITLLCSAVANAEDTALSLYHPLMNAVTHQPEGISAKKSGECKQQSELIKREDAWRCVAEGKVYDPCFVQPYSSNLSAVCPESPWSKQGVEISVTSPLNNSQHTSLDMSRTFPWAIELTSGDKCQAIETNEQFDGLPVHYRCDSRSELIGHVQRCEGMWKMLQHAANGVDTAMIARAWF